MTSKVGVAHKISRAVYLAPPLSQSWIRPCLYKFFILFYKMTLVTSVAVVAILDGAQDPFMLTICSAIVESTDYWTVDLTILQMAIMKTGVCHAEMVTISLKSLL